MSGYFFLNCRATPLPITPSVFTVLTRASTSASRRLPVTSSSIGNCLRLVVIPVRFDRHARSMIGPLRERFNARRHDVVDDAYLSNVLPWEPLMHKELRLLPSL